MKLKLDDVLLENSSNINFLKLNNKSDFYVNVLESNDGFKIISTNIKSFNRNYKPVVNLSSENYVESSTCNCENNNDSEHIYCEHVLLLLDKYHHLISVGTPKEDAPIKRVVGNITYYDYPYTNENIKVRGQKQYLEEEEND